MSIRHKTITKKRNKVALLRAMKIGKKYRPYQFNKINLRPSTIARYMNELDDEGLINRVLENGLIYWVRR